VREWAHENKETTWKHTVVQREQMNRVTLCYCLLSQIGAFLGYSLLQVTSTHHHHSLFDHCNCVALSAVTGAVPSDSKSPERVDWMWTSVGGGDNGDGRRWSSQNDTGGNVDSAPQYR
jgi:hypothetical protein